MTDPYIPTKKPGDPILAKDWNDMQTLIREHVTTHNHTGTNSGVKLTGEAIDPQSTLTIKKLEAGALTVASAVSIEAAGDATSPKKALNFYASLSDPDPAWVVSLNPRSNPADSTTAKPGLSIGDATGVSRLFVERGSGRLGVGTLAPQAALHIDRGAGNDLALMLSSSGSNWGSGLILRNTGDNPSQFGIYAGAGLRIYDVAAKAERMIITKDGNVGIGAPPSTTTKLHVAGLVKASGYAGENKLVLDDFQQANLTSNVSLYSPPGDRDAWIYLDSANAGNNWGIYHRQLDTPVKGLPGNSIGFVGGGDSSLKAYIGLGDGSGFFAGSLSVGTTLSVAGDATIKGSLGPTSIKGNLTVAGGMVSIDGSIPNVANNVSLRVYSKTQPNQWAGRITAGGDTSVVLVGESSGAAAISAQNSALASPVPLLINPGPGTTTGINTRSPDPTTALTVDGGATIRVLGSPSWDRLNVIASKEWDSGTSIVTLGTGGPAGIHLSNPHVTWRNERASIRYGRVNSASDGAYWDAGVRKDSAFSFIPFAVGANHGKECLKITSDGNVGIGTPAPRCRLDVPTGNAYLGQTLTIGAPDDGVNGAILNLTNETSKRAWHTTIRANEADKLIFWRYDTVGFAPVLKLGMDGVVEAPGSVCIGNTTPSNTALRVYAKSVADQRVGWIAAGGDKANVVLGEYNDMAVLGGHNGALNAWTNLVLNPYLGNVGIGVVPAEARLQVNGTAKIHAGLQVNGAVGIGTAAPQKNLHVQGATSAPFLNDPNADRPGIAVTGHYPEITLFSNVNNTTHGPTIRLGSYTDAEAKTHKNWVIGTSGRNSSFLDFGFSDKSDPNPHAGIRNTNGRTVLTLREDGAVEAPGRAILCGAAAPIHITSTWGFNPDKATNAAEICNDTVKHKTLMIVGNRSGTERRVSIWDRLDINGSAFVNGSAVFASDRVLKRDITPLKDALARALELRPVSFHWTTTGKPDIGLIAQDVEAILPELVTTQEVGPPGEPTTPVRALQYNGIAVLALAAIQELKTEVDVLRRTLAELIDRD